MRVGTIAIDGPVAAGKTVVGRELAQRLGFRYLDTGVMYRAITWLAARDQVPVSDAAALGQLARDNPVRLSGRDSDRVLVREYELGPELREAAVEGQVSQVSSVSQVRQALVQQQRDLAAQGEIVMVGRDIGTVVLPDADLKLYMSAAAEERARRRHQDLLRQGRPVEYRQVLEETRNRDRIDSQRADSPLRPAADALLVETDQRSVEQVVEFILERVQQRCREPGRREPGQ